MPFAGAGLVTNEQDAMSNRLLVLAGMVSMVGACGGAQTANDSAQAPVDSGLTISTPLTDNLDTTKSKAGGTRADTTRRGTTKVP